DRPRTGCGRWEVSGEQAALVLFEPAIASLGSTASDRAGCCLRVPGRAGTRARRVSVLALSLAQFSELRIPRGAESLLFVRSHKQRRPRAGRHLSAGPPSLDSPNREYPVPIQ